MRGLLKQSPNLCASFSSNRLPLPLSSEHLPDDDDGYDKLFTLTERKHIGKYIKELTHLVHRETRTGLVEALKLYDEMRKVGRKKLQPIVYTLLITGCAKNGYLDKAFELFGEELKRKLRPTKATITSLLNACAECPYPDKGLEKIEYLRHWAQLNAVTFNYKQYTALIKAYGKLGQLDKAYQVVNEMFERHISLSSRSFANLLTGCIANREKGFGEAIKIFRRMVFHGVPRELDTYKLLLQAARSCKVGTAEEFEKTLYVWLNSERIVYHSLKKPSVYDGKQVKEPSFEQDVTFEYTPEGSLSYITEFQRGFKKYLNPGNVKDIVPRRLEGVNPYLIPEAPNFLIPSIQNSMGKVVDIDYYSLVNPCNRLALIGGVEGILTLMKIDKVKPDIAVFCQLLNLVKNDNEAENQILNLAIENSALETTLFNILITRKCERGDLAAAKKTLETMQKYHCYPNILTFSALAKGCYTLPIGQTFLNDLKNMGIRPNSPILKALLENSCRAKDYEYIKLILRNYQQHNISPTRRILDVLIHVLQDESQTLLAIERGKLKPQGKYTKVDRKKALAELDSFFEDWCSKVELEKEREPWDQYKFKREDWGLYKVRQFEKEMIKRTTERPEFKELLESGEEFSVKKLLHSEFAD